MDRELENIRREEAAELEIDQSIAAMTLGELREAQNQYRGGLRRQWRPEDHRQAAQEAAVVSATGVRATDLHPLAAQLLERGPVGPARLAELLATAEGRPWSGTLGEIVALATASAHYPTAVTEAARAVLNARPSPFLPDLLAVAADVRVQTYAEEGFGLVDIDLSAPDANSGQLFTAITPHMLAQAAQTFSTFGKLILTIQALANDDANFLPSAVTAFATAAHRGEMEKIAALLEANILPDGAALFDAGNSNVGTGAVTAAGLGVGMALLRAQPTEAGKPAGAPVRALMVHPDQEASWLAVIESLPAERRPRLVVNPFLTGTDWYAFSDPLAFPALARVLLVSADQSGVSVSGTSPASWEDEERKVHDIPGIAVDVTHTVGLMAVSAVGVAKLSLS